MAAPILLTLLRLVQGFAVGGEWGGATLMAVEHAPPGRRGFFGAFPQMGAPAGVGLATIAFFLATKLEPGQFQSWGWRLPFLFSALLVVVGLVIRLSVAESPEFEKVRERQVRVKLPIAEAFRRHPREIFLVAGTYLSQGVLAYICMSYLVSYASTEIGIARPDALFGVFVAAVVAVVLYPVFGSLADRWGRKTTYLLGAVLMLVTIGPAFALINTGSAAAFTAALVLVFGIAMAPAGGVTGSLFSMVFSPEVRFSGASIGYTISQLAGAAFAPLIATALFAASGSSVPVVIYLLVVCAISVGSVLLLPTGPGGPRLERGRHRGPERSGVARTGGVSRSRGVGCRPPARRGATAHSPAARRRSSPMICTVPRMCRSISERARAPSPPISACRIDAWSACRSSRALASG